MRCQSIRKNDGVLVVTIEYLYQRYLSIYLTIESIPGCAAQAPDLAPSFSRQQTPTGSDLSASVTSSSYMPALRVLHHEGLRAVGKHEGNETRPMLCSSAAA